MSGTCLTRRNQVSQSDRAKPWIPCYDLTVHELKRPRTDQTVPRVAWMYGSFMPLQMCHMGVQLQRSGMGGKQVICYFTGAVSPSPDCDMSVTATPVTNRVSAGGRGGRAASETLTSLPSVKPCWSLPLGCQSLLTAPSSMYPLSRAS